MITLNQLHTAMPACNAGIFFVPLAAAMQEFDITTSARMAMFLAQIGHESADLQQLTEGLNYSADGLANTWPNRYALPNRIGPTGRKLPNALALSLHRRPGAIANNCYANRGGNGDEQSGDGWRFRGAGGIQLTFRDGHLAAAKQFDMPLADVPAWLRTPVGACRSAAWFWWRAGCNAMADRADFDGVSDLINIGRKTAKEGDAIGFDDRRVRYLQACRGLA